MGRETGRHLASLLEYCITQKSHKSGRVLHAHILRTNLTPDVFLSNRLIEFYSKSNAISSARYVFDSMPDRNIYSWNAMLCACCASGKLCDAQLLFDEMPERSVVSWNNMISAHVKVCEYQKALEFFRLMISECLVPTSFTLASVLSACGGLLDGDFGRSCHSLAVKVGVYGSIFVGNSLLGMYAKIGSIDDSVKVFEELPEPNEVSFTSMMGGLAEMDKVEDALRMFRLMHRSRICIDAVSLSSVLVVCARVGGNGGSSDDCLLPKGQGLLVHGLAVKLGFQNDFHLMNSLLAVYSKSGDMENAEMVFHSLPAYNTVPWNIMIAGYGQRYQIDKAMELMRRMECLGFEPDEVTFINMVAACVKSGDIVLGRKVFDKIGYPSLNSWNAMLSGYSQIENHKEAIMLFREMQFRHVKPDMTTLAIILGSCAGIGLLDCGKQVHAVTIKAQFHSDVYVGSALITMYSRCHKIQTAKWIFDRLPTLDIVCWNSIIAGFSLNTRDEKAFIYYNNMKTWGMAPTQFTYATLLSCCAEQTFSSQGRQIHAQIMKEGYMNDVFVGSALINMYCKCGDVKGGRQLFDTMPVKNTVIWNEMIHGYAQIGCGDEAIKLYDSMIVVGEKPDDATFVAVLTACSHSGLVDRGIKIFESIDEPHLEHYTCIIDAFGRGGRLSAAEFLLAKMPCKDDPVIWEVLLSSCRIHNDVAVARRAAEKIFRLDPENSTPYLLLANIYSSLGRWDEAGAIRELMSDKSLRKDPGGSWIQYTDIKEDFEARESYLAGLLNQNGLESSKL